MPTSALPAILLLLTLTSTAGAQDSPSRMIGPQPSQVRGAVLRGPLQEAFSVDSVRRQIRPTHWKEGALVGGIVTGLGLALLIDGLCSSDSGGNCGSAVTGGLLGGGVVGGVVGALIGGQFPKSEER
jgi:hypothetical protein